jgi:hypothetical protein
MGMMPPYRTRGKAPLSDWSSEANHYSAVDTGFNARLDIKANPIEWVVVRYVSGIFCARDDGHSFRRFS